MKFSTLYSGAALVLAPILGEARQSVPKGAMKFDIEGFRSGKPPTARFKDIKYSNLLKRDVDGTLQGAVDNEFTHYNIEIELGTPGQKQKVVLDTGSSDLWVLGKDNPYCAKTKKEKAAAKMRDGYILCDDSVGTFEEKDSKTYHNNDTDFYIRYGDSSFAQGNWGTDVLKIGDTKVEDVSFAVGEKSNSTVGVFGIGFKDLESIAVDVKTGKFHPENTYDNFPILLKQQEIVKKLAYSLWLNDPDAKQGNVLFGGVDHAKYNGDLQKVPIVNNLMSVDHPIELTIMLSSLGIKQKKGDDINIFSENLPVLLDSGSTACLLPSSVVYAVADALGAKYSFGTGTFNLPCEVADYAGSFVFDLSGIKIEVPFSDMILPIRDLDKNPLRFQNKKHACQLAMTPASDTLILGDSFLRSAYVVYDLEDYEVAIAPVKFNESKADIEVIESDIPKAKAASGYSNTEFATSLSVNTEISLDGYKKPASTDIGYGFIPGADTHTAINTRNSGLSDYTFGRHSSMTHDNFSIRSKAEVTRTSAFSTPGKSASAASTATADSSNGARSVSDLNKPVLATAFLTILFSLCILS